MASRRPRLGQYLEWHNGAIRVTIPVPKALQSAVGATRLKQSLRTDSPANAERIKHSVIHELKGRIAAAERPVDGLTSEAMDWRQTLAAGDGGPRDILPILLSERAEEIEVKHGEAAAHEFVAIADGRATPILTLLDAYLSTCGLAPRTKHGIRRCVTAYVEWARANGEPTAIEQVTRKVAGRFVTDHLLPRLAPTSAGTYTKFLSGYWGYLEGRGYVEGSPWKGQLRGVAKARRRQSVLLASGKVLGGKRPYTDAEARKLLYAIPNGATDARTKDLIWLGALSGMRLDEICRLRVADCADGWFSVNADGKGKSAAAVRRVPIHPQLAAIVARRTVKKAPDAYLIEDLPEPPVGSIRERSMPASKAYTRFRRRLGVDEQQEGERQSNVDFHSWRRWFIREARDAGCSPWTIADLVGHDTTAMPLGLTMGVYPGPASAETLIACVVAVQPPAAVQRAVERGGN
jgi:integrase